MSVATETYAEMEAAILAAPNAIGITLTTELYRQLDYPGEPHQHFKEANGAIFYGEEPKPLYQLPVRLEEGAHHMWSLRYDRGAGPSVRDADMAVDQGR
jgi:hypothetical protein